MILACICWRLRPHQVIDGTYTDIGIPVVKMFTRPELIVLVTLLFSNFSCTLNLPEPDIPNFASTLVYECV